MGRDESGTLARLREHRTQRLEPTLSRHGGPLVKLTGDGALAEFPSAVDALGAAIEFQQSMAEVNAGQSEETRIVFRIGLHSGDLIVDGDDLYGDGVNVAARLEAEAAPGGIVLSRTIHEAVSGRLKATFEDLGSLTLKNIERPVQAFKVKWEPADWNVPATTAPAPTTAIPPAADIPLALPDKPSIAVLPFQNMSGDPEQEYFADGMVADIITALSRTKALLVIARNSSFAYKGKSPDIRQVGRELGVRYVLEGSVRKAGDRVRIIVQLIDATNGGQIWADRFEGGQEQVFDLQDEVAARVVRVIQPTLIRVEIERSRRKPLKDARAFDWYLRGLSLFYQASRETNDEALSCFGKAVELDSGFALALSSAALCHLRRNDLGMVADDTEDKRQAEQLAQRALDLDSGDPRVLCNAGFVFQNVNRMEESAPLFDLALQLDPNNPSARQGKGWNCIFLGEDGAIEHFQSGFALNPLDPRAADSYLGIANAQYLAGDYDGAAATAAKGLRLRPRHTHLLGVSMCAHAMAGRLEEARRIYAIYMEINPWARVSKFRRWYPLRRDEDFAKAAAGLRLAGMPE
jgi:adenylate cyclase